MLLDYTLCCVGRNMPKKTSEVSETSEVCVLPHLGAEFVEEGGDVVVGVEVEEVE